MKIVITGGHFTPALAIIEVLEREGWKIYWIGEERALSGHDSKTLEARFLPKTQIPFFPIFSLKVNSRDPVSTVLNSWKFILGAIQSFFVLLKVKPDVVLSFGSYVSVPVALTAWVFRIPIVLHEQTATSGLANRFVSRFAKRIAISYPQSAKSFPAGKTVLTGNPLRKGILNLSYRNSLMNESGIKRKGRLVLYITGGSRGAQKINSIVQECLPELLKNFEVYHQTGEVDFDDAENYKKSLLPREARRYNVASTYSPYEVEKIFSKTDIVISRAGANTVTELAALGLPSILIPLYWARNNEQYENAKLLEEFGGALILDEKDLSKKTLEDSVLRVLNNLGRFKMNAKKARSLVIESAADKLLELIKETAKCH